MAMNALRTAVSGNRNRYIQDGYNLDLTYITDRLIAMGLPSSGVEGTYRNNIDHVVDFLTARHGTHFLVVNLSERKYDYSKFFNQVIDFGFPDHHAPPLDVLWAACHSIDAWLSLDDRNVACVHCKAGKGRTGVVIASYMLFVGMYDNAGASPKRMSEMAMNNFLSRRGEGVTYPSQKRYVRYFAEMLPVMRRQLAEAAPVRVVRPASMERQASGSTATHGSVAGAGEGAGAGAGGTGTSPGSGSSSTTAGRDDLHPLRYWRFLGGVVHDTGKTTSHALGAAALERRRQDSLRAAPDRMPTLMRASSDGAGTEYLKEAFRRIKGVKVADMPLPPPRKFLLTTLIMSDVPVLPGIVKPVITVRTAPRQHGDSKVVYNSVWDNPDPAEYVQGQGCIVFQLKNCVVCGDVLIQCENMPGRDLLWFVSFHTSFVTDDQISGVWRLQRDDIDMENRSKNLNRLQPDFFIDMVFDGSTVTDDTEALMTTERPREGVPSQASSDARESVAKPRKTALDKINALGDSSFDHTTISAVTMKNGWLCKQGAFIKNWKKRWFVLRNQTLSYYVRETDAKPKGAIPLEKCHGVTQCREDETKGRPFCFRLNHAHRTYYFQAGNAQELEDWVCMIALAIASAQPDVVTPPAARATSYSSGLRPDDGRASHEPAARSMSSRTNARAARAAAHQENVLLTAQVKEFYRVNNPEKCNERHIARVVESYQGRAEALWEDLRRKYPGVQLPPSLPVAPPVPPSRPTAAVQAVAAPGGEGEDSANNDRYAAP